MDNSSTLLESKTVKMLDNGNSTEKLDYDDSYPPLEEQGKALPVFSKQETLKYKNDSNPTESVVKSYQFVIQPVRRKFKDSKLGEMKKILSSIDLTLNVKASVSITKMGSLMITLHGESAQNISTVHKYLEDSLSLPTYETITVPKEYMARVLGKEKRNLTKFIDGKPLEVKTNGNCITLSGGVNVVKEVSVAIRKYVENVINSSSETVEISESTYFFICGPFQKTLKEIKEKSGLDVKIIFGERLNNKQKIFLSGPREGVKIARNFINSICTKYEGHLKRCVLKLSKNIFHHLNCDILFEKTGCYIEIEISSESSIVVTILGEEKNITLAESELQRISDLHSVTEVSAPSWIMLYLKSNPSFLGVLTDLDEAVKTHLDMTINKVIIEGHSSILDRFKGMVSTLIDKLIDDLKHKIVKFDKSYLSQIIGKSGIMINSIRTKSKATIVSLNPSETDLEAEIVVIGSTEEVKLACKLIDELKVAISKMVTLELQVPFRLHGYIIGSKGDRLKTVISEYGADCSVSFPKQSDSKSETVSIRGPVDQANSLCDKLKSLSEYYAFENYRSEITIPKKYYPILLGKGGKFIREVKEQTHVQSISLPAIDDTDDVIVIDGRKPNCESAKRMIENKYAEISNLDILSLQVNSDLVKKIRGHENYVLKKIIDDMDSEVQVKFTDIGKDTKVTIIGPKEVATRCLKVIADITRGNCSKYNSDVIYIDKKRYHNILQSTRDEIRRKISETCCSVYFSTLEKDADKGGIFVVGAVDRIPKAKSIIQGIVSEIEMFEEIIIPFVNKHRRFLLYRLYGNDESLIQHLTESYPGISISFPPTVLSSEKSQIIVRGPKSFVQQVKSEITTEIERVENCIRSSMSMSLNSLKRILRYYRNDLSDCTNMFKVEVEYPREYNKPDQDMEKKINFILSGTPQGIEKVKEFLGEREFVTESCAARPSMFRYIIGPNAKRIRELREDFDVNVKLVEEESLAYVSGPRFGVRSAIEKINEILRDNHETFVNVDPLHYNKLIGKNGKTISALKQMFHVSVIFPPKDSQKEQEIKITGSEENCEKAKEHIIKKVEEWSSYITGSVLVKESVRSKFFGRKISYVFKLSTDNEVDIRTVDVENSNNVILNITGLPENVEKCKIQAENILKEIFQHLDENFYYTGHDEDYFDIDIQSIPTSEGKGNKKKKSAKNEIQVSSDNNIQSSQSGIPSNTEDKG